jgi:pyruvate/2-oxoglutarate dehydrogenase complex dihydrolipoamide dehydrogenase (E3) component
MNILILGGGYAGLMTALRLGNRGLGSHVTLVNAVPDFVERVRHHQLGAGTAPPRRSITRLLRGTGVRFVVGRVTRLDLDRRVARLVGGGELGFDRVVFALGSVGDAGAVPGVREHASVIGDEAGALRLRAQRARGARDVVVVGGGPTGIETAAALAEQGARVALVASPGVGGFLSPVGQWYLLRALAGEAEGPFRIGDVPLCLSLGRRDGLLQLAGRRGQPGSVITGRTAAWIKEIILRFTVWALRLERHFAFALWPKPRRLPPPRPQAKRLAA